MEGLKGKRALITGAARGIGAGIAMTLADRGADVVITYERSAERAAEVVEAVQKKGRRAYAIQADSADAVAVKRSVDEASAWLGGLDILVNNAGVLFSNPLEEMDVDVIDKIISINIRSVVLASKAALAYLGEGGRIISIGSCLAERVAIPEVTIYSMSKSALLSFTRGLARELGPRNITVNLVHPGPTDTDMNPADGPTADFLRSQIALGRFGQVEDVAGAVAFLAGPSGRHITGTGLVVDGGINA